MTDTTSTPKPPPPPEGLTKVGRKDGPGRRLWKQIAGSGNGAPKYVLRPDELRILEDACKLADQAAKYEAEFVGKSTTVRGSTGQMVIHPVLAEERQCRVAIAMLLSKIKLPEDAGEAAPRSVNARNAAQSRWNKTGT